jgi:uncharacterized protein YjiS (DUF1127 family)
MTIYNNLIVNFLIKSMARRRHFAMLNEMDFRHLRDFGLSHADVIALHTH